MTKTVSACCGAEIEMKHRVYVGDGWEYCSKCKKLLKYLTKEEVEKWTTPTNPPTETNEAPESASFDKVREVHPDYTSYYNVKGHGLRIRLVDKYGVMVGSRYMTKSDLDAIIASSVQEAKAGYIRKIEGMDYAYEPIDGKGGHTQYGMGHTDGYSKAMEDCLAILKGET